MLTLHHLENSCSQRILWLLEEPGVDYEVKQYARDPNTNLPAECPKLATFLERIRAMPTYRAGIEKGGPYALMGGRK